ncbi:2OG-Fe(II) oxygenase [Terricaulis sp.]|uniref:2OG-Fe(II) oxygenase n=1 Tax=Terricaulis sp. TaxID=2768686 RepID=UPI0037848EF9
MVDSRIAGLVEAAKAGNAYALTQLAHAQALGVFMSRNVDMALDNLVRAASAHWPDAKRELEILARRSGAGPKKLRDCVNVETLRRPPPRRALLESPRVRVFEGFATPQECDWLIERARPLLGPAQVYQDASAELTQHEGRSNSEASFDFEAADVVLAMIYDRIARASGVPIEHFEVGKLLHYKPGETFARHTDFLETGGPMDEEIAARGQRVATFLTYLSDDYDAGETEFTDAGFKFKARKGDALMFLNVDSEGRPDPMSMHAGTPPTRGEKWVLSLWLRGKTVNSHHTPRVTAGRLPPEWYRDA